MFALFGRMFGSAKAGEAIIDGVSNGIDKMWHTAEEKADDAARAKREGMAVFMGWLESTSGSRIARRVIALIITFPWALANFISLILDAAAPFIQGAETITEIINGQAVEVLVLKGDKFAAAADSLSENALENTELVGVVLLFYFGGPAAIDGVKHLVDRWTRKKYPAKDAPPGRVPGPVPAEHPSR
jgi:hypothetical protein